MWLLGVRIHPLNSERCGWKWLLNKWSPFAVGSSTDAGVFYGGSGNQLGVQILGALVISIWTMTLSFLLFFGLKMYGWLRVPREEEIVGLDISCHGGSAFGYDEKTKTTPRADY